MEYKIISGRTEEIRHVWMPTTRGGQRVRRGTRAKKSSIRKILRNEIESLVGGFRPHFRRRLPAAEIKPEISSISLLQMSRYRDII